ncbi:hypothetical protein ACIPSA_49175 [Streptomyces sp. NPDC086549]|uniref:hypothetical protein n=1 Tax=Streptomyces sp. NPDC086549 TaxID=3365752 RepID=UPI0037FA7E35
MRAECALIEHPTLKRWLRTSKNGQLAIDRAKVKAEERLDGTYLLTSSDPHLSAEEIAVGYKALLEADRGGSSFVTPVRRSARFWMGNQAEQL